jgi:hypothetical protein
MDDSSPPSFCLRASANFGWINRKIEHPARVGMSLPAISTPATSINRIPLFRPLSRSNLEPKQLRRIPAIPMHNMAAMRIMLPCGMRLWHSSNSISKADKKLQRGRAIRGLQDFRDRSLHFLPFLSLGARSVFISTSGMLLGRFASSSLCIYLAGSTLSRSRCFDFFDAARCRC